MENKLKIIIERYEKLNHLLSQQETINDINQYKSLSKEHSSLQETFSLGKKYIKQQQQLKENKELLESDDLELAALAREEIELLQNDISKNEEELKILLIPKDKNDNKNIILEIRGGTGGDEATLIAADLYRMYMRFSEQNKWKLETYY